MRKCGPAPRRWGPWAPSPSHSEVSLPPLPLVQYPRWFESTFWSQVAVGPLFLRDARPRSESSPPGRFLGRRPCTRSAIVRWQEATDPQSADFGSQRACHTEGAHPTASGRRTCHHASTAGTLRKCGVAPRRLGPWAPSPSHCGVFGAPPLGAIPTLVREYLFVASGSWASVSLGCQPGSSESSPSSPGRF